MIQNTTPPAIVLPAEPTSAFVTSLKARKERYDRCCAMANELSIPKPHPFAGDETFAEIESAYAQHEVDYARWLEIVTAEREEVAAETSGIDADLDAAAASPVSRVEEVCV